MRRADSRSNERTDGPALIVGQPFTFRGANGARSATLTLIRALAGFCWLTSIGPTGFTPVVTEFLIAFLGLCFVLQWAARTTRMA